jgi:radical SAM superfamily enzyme YgiQ (UPF0313 family)
MAGLFFTTGKHGEELLLKSVLLINPNRIRPPVTPVGLDYVAAALEGQGFKVELLDFAWEADPRAAVREVLAGQVFEAVGISVRNTDDCCLATKDFLLPRIKDLVGLLKSLTESPVVLGGCGFSVAPEASLLYCGADFGIAGDGEWAMPELLNAVRQGLDVFEIPGLVYRLGERAVSNRPRYHDLAGPGSPVRRPVADNTRYFREGGQVGIETKRGCDRKCIYCADPLAKGGKLRPRPKSLVVREIESFLAHGIDCFHLCDSEFNIPAEHAREVCREIAAAGLGRQVRWYTYASPGHFSAKLARLMREAGCAGINFGVDSAHPGILRILGRDFSPADIVAAVQACNQEGIACMLDLLIGGPGETPDTVKETVRLVKGLNVTAVGVSVGIRIYRGTTIEKMVEQEGFNLQNTNLRGKVEGNRECLEPVFYLSSALGSDPEAYIAGLISPDRRFFFMSPDETRNYNYNQNINLSEAIRKGCRGAYWHILRTIDNVNPDQEV